jgi:hypothetical protein
MPKAESKSTTPRLSPLICDPFVRSAFERAERDEGPQPVEARAPEALSGGQTQELEVA